MKTPHLLLAASNCRKLLQNLGGLLDHTAKNAIELEIRRNTIGLYRLALEHQTCAQIAPNQYWRIKISRFYYAVYNARRAVQLFVDGLYRTDVGDHKNIDEFPSDFPNINTYKIELVSLREDRNLADYDHDATEADLVTNPAQAEAIAVKFLADVKTYLASRGVNL